MVGWLGKTEGHGTWQAVCTFAALVVCLGCPRVFSGSFCGCSCTGCCHLFSSFLGWSCLSRPIGLTVRVGQRLVLLPDRLKAVWSVLDNPW